jgi:hypothetical protein
MQQLVLQFPVEDIADYDAVIELEELLISGVGDRAEVDAHDVGLGAMNVFIWTDDARSTFATVRELLADHSLGPRSPLDIRNATRTTTTRHCGPKTSSVSRSCSSPSRLKARVKVPAPGECASAPVASPLLHLPHVSSTDARAERRLPLPSRPACSAADVARRRACASSHRRSSTAGRCSAAPD